MKRDTYGDVTLAEMLRLTAYYDDNSTFRWVTVNEDLSVRVTFGEVRRAILTKEKADGGEGPA